MIALSRTVAGGPPPPPPRYPYRLPARAPIAINLEDEAKGEFDSAKLISDDSSSDAEDTDIENYLRYQIWNI